MPTSAESLASDATGLGVSLSEADAGRLLRLLDELERWNRRFNLTAIRQREEMVTHHVLDSLAVQRYLSGTRIADVGTGAGFPGLPLAIVNPERRFALIDSNGRKIRFVSHAAHLLGLENVEPVQERVEAMHPAERFDTVIARAFAPLPELLAKVRSLCGPQTRVLAMKGRLPEEELAALASPWRLERAVETPVPRLDAARCLLMLRQEAASDP